VSKEKKQLSKLIIIINLNFSYGILIFCTSNLFSVLRSLQPSQCGETRVNEKRKQGELEKNGKNKEKEEGERK